MATKKIKCIFDKLPEKGIQ